MHNKVGLGILGSKKNEELETRCKDVVGSRYSIDKTIKSRIQESVSKLRPG